MIFEFPNNRQDQPASLPDETTPELHPWSTPHVQSLNGAGRDTQGGPMIGQGEISSYHPS
jgi:hypothetical protein